MEARLRKALPEPDRQGPGGGTHDGRRLFVEKEPPAAKKAETKNENSHQQGGSPGRAHPQLS